MLAYYYKKKGIYERKEDSLTASVFNTMLYLPADMLLSILSESLIYKAGFPLSLGEIEHFEFWPKWDATNTSNKRDVEPDLWIKFEYGSILIEAKLNKFNSQTEKQIRNEIIAFKNEYATEKAYMIQISGLTAPSPSPDIEGVPIYKTDWVELLRSIHNNMNNALEGDRSSLRILNDLVKAFALNQIFNFIWPNKIKIEHTIKPICAAHLFKFTSNRNYNQKWPINIRTRQLEFINDSLTLFPYARKQTR